MIIHFVYLSLVFALGASDSKNAKRNKLILISFDGMRWDYLDKYGPFKNFDELRTKGVYTDGLQSQFVTKVGIYDGVGRLLRYLGYP